MEALDITLAERGQIVIPKEARDALGLKAGSKLEVRIEGNRLLITKKVALDLSRWVGAALDDGLTRDQALAELRGRPVPWQTVGTQAAQKAGKTVNAVKAVKPVKPVKPVKAKR